MPLVLVCIVTRAWRITRPRWKLAAKIVLHPCLYALLSLWMGHPVIALAWIHQGLFGLGGHIWFCKTHGFTWYSVEDPQRYAILSQETVLNTVAKRRR